VVANDLLSGEADSGRAVPAGEVVVATWRRRRLVW